MLWQGARNKYQAQIAIGASIQQNPLRPGSGKWNKLYDLYFPGQSKNVRAKEQVTSIKNPESGSPES